MRPTSDRVVFGCRQCRRQVSLKREQIRELSGQRVSCPHCGHSRRLRVIEDEPAAAQASVFVPEPGVPPKPPPMPIRTYESNESTPTERRPNRFWSRVPLVKKIMLIVTAIWMISLPVMYAKGYYNSMATVEDAADGMGELYRIKAQVIGWISLIFPTLLWGGCMAFLSIFWFMTKEATTIHTTELHRDRS